MNLSMNRRGLSSPHDYVPAAAFVAALIMSLLATTGVDAAYVLFMRSFGEWSVVCARDEPTGRQACVLGAPAPAMAPSPVGVRARIEISADDDDRPAVRLFIHHVVDTDRPVSLRIDTHPPHSAQAARGGEADWRGPAAAGIVGQMATGRSLVVRFFEPGGLTARERFFSLAEFPDAFATFRNAEKRLRQKGS